MKKRYILFMILLFIPFISIIKAADLSEYFNIQNVKFCTDTDCNNIIDDIHGIKSDSMFLTKIEWSLESPEPIADGDTVTIPFANNKATENSSSFSGGTFSWTNIYDNNSNKIGEWRIAGEGENKRIFIKFSDNAIGKYNASGIFQTPKTMHTNYSFKDIVVPIRIGNNDNYRIKIITYPLELSGNNPSVYYASPTNNSVVIRTVSPKYTIRQLYDNNNYSDFTNDAIISDLFLELIIPSNINLQNMTNLSIQALYSLPTDLENHKVSENFNRLKMTSFFTEISQNENESYLDFKNRLNKFEYGIYTDQNGNKTLVINYGDQPNNNITYSQIINNIDSSLFEPGDYSNSLNPFTVNDDVKKLINNLVGRSNRISGKVVCFGSEIKLEFPTVNVDTTKQVSGTWSWRNESGEIKTKQTNVKFDLVVPSSMAKVSGVSQILLRDKDSKNEIVGVKIKLQKKNGDTYVDFDESTTDFNGLVNFKNLESGVYRYIQTSYLDHYKTNSFKMYADESMNNVISEFEFDADTGNIVYATNEREKFTVTYKKGTHGNFDNQVYSDIPYGDSTPYYEPVGEDDWIFKGWNPDYELFVTDNATYTATWSKLVDVTARYLELGTNNKLIDDIVDTKENGKEYETEKKEIENYEFVRVDGKTSGIRGEEDIVVTYYYKKKESNLKIKYLDCNTKREIASSTNEIVYYGDNYDSDTYEANVVIPENYNRISASKTDNYKGVVDSDNINVEYCYNKKDSNLNTSITMKGTDKITKSKDKVSYQINYNTVFTDYIGEATIKIVDTLPYKIDVNESNLDGGVYDDNAKTITWNVNENINSYENSEYKVTKNIELKYKNINLLEDVIVNNVSGKTEIESKNKEVATHYNTYIDVKGTIVVKYLENSTSKELIDSITTTDNVGKEYEFVNKDIEGYRLVKKPIKEKEEYKEETQEFKFLYERIKYKITVTSNEGGSVTGDEEVYYNEDSKEDNIRIKANDNYYIKEIRINEKVIKILERSKELTIPQFKNMMEDKKIEVVFDNVNETVIVPNTLKKSMLIIFGLVTLLGSMGIMLYIFYSKKIILKKHQ